MGNKDDDTKTFNTSEKARDETLDDVLEKIGGFGLYQKWIFVLTCYPYLLAGFFELNPVFILGVPEHRCAIPGYDNDTYKVQGDEHQSLIDLFIPPSTDADTVYDKCEMFHYKNESAAEAWMNETNGRTKIPCNSWVYDKTVFTSTFVSQVDLVCDKQILTANAEMIFYGGMLFGSILSGLLADRYGRKPVMCISGIVMMGSSIGLAWVNDFWLFCVLQFIIGTSILALFMPGYVLSLEVTSPTKRFWPGIVSNYPYSIGLIILTGIAYGCRDWFYIQLYTSLPGIILITYWWLIPESPRWLLSKGRVKEAEDVIRSVAKWNKTEMPAGNVFEKLSVKNEVTNVSFIHLFSRVTMCKISLLVFFNWFAVSVAYFGLALNSYNLGSDLYLNFGLSGSVEFPAYIICTYVAERFGRRVPFSLFMVIGGAACISTVFTISYGSEVITLVLALVGRFCNTVAFSIVYIHSAELFPTVVRNAGIGGGSVFARIGSMTAPYIVTLLETAFLIENRVEQLVLPFL
ncbi:organic cation transporter protein-like isoform X2 [Ruditapes philippinarum]|uniref:organic cation transporter protein-like isoform X2 n=1 Tax=Ruditapes philippinarum TaxID=129788 RepID=UPI00295AAA4F|nr:organic cation transporter protein-like isoform X2 [Ruditapes philippinarum]